MIDSQSVYWLETSQVIGLDHVVNTISDNYCFYCQGLTFSVKSFKTANWFKNPIKVALFTILCISFIFLIGIGSFCTNFIKVYPSQRIDHFPILESTSGRRITQFTHERSQNTILLASTQAVYKAPHSTVWRERERRECGHKQMTSSRSSSRKSQSVRLEHNTVESVAASCTYASAINASKCIQCICCVQT